MHIKFGKRKVNTDQIVKREEMHVGNGNQAERKGTRVFLTDGSSFTISEAQDTHIDTVLGADYNDTYQG